MDRRRLLLLPLLACVACGAVTPPTPRLALPPRSRDAEGGAAFAGRVADLPLAERERELRAALFAGNVPELLRAFVPVAVDAEVAGRTRRATFFVLPDYVGVGADGDWLRAPMTPGLAQELADRVGCVLPTRHMVDAIWRAAPVHVAPRPFHPRDHDIVSLALFHRHHGEVERQLAAAAAAPGALVAGHKKDVVVSALLADWPDRVCIYGWHHRDGRPIQPLSKVHTWPHVDYSHGVRLVARAMLVDGEAADVVDVLADPELHVLLSDEGPIATARYER